MRSIDNFVGNQRLRTELRIPDSATGLDQALTAIRNSAASFVHSQTGIPILDEDRYVVKARPASDGSLIVKRWFGRVFLGVRYWTPDADPNANPDGELDSHGVGEIGVLPDDAGLLIRPPAGGWPAMADDARVYVRITEGIPEDHQNTPILRQAGIMAARYFFNGAKFLERDSGMIRVLRAVRPLTRRMDDPAYPDMGEGTVLTYGGSGVTLGGVRMAY